MTVPYFPAAHATGAAVPLGQYEPAGHGVTASLLAPAGQKYPVEQLPAQLDADVTALKRPAGHGEQVTAPVSLYCPMSQLVPLAAPVGQYLPLMHGRAVGDKLPSGQ